MKSVRGIFEAVWQVGGGITTVMGDVAMAAHAGLNWGECSPAVERERGGRASQ